MNKFIIIPVVLASSILASCDQMLNPCIDGNGHPSTETRTLPSFTEIQVNGDFLVEVITDTASVAVVKTDENIQNLVKTHVSGDKLVIESKNNDCLNPSQPIEIRVLTPSVTRIELNGSGYVHCHHLNTEDLVLRLSGSGQIECTEITASSAKLVVEGSGNIECGADVEDLYSQIEGSGEIKITGIALNSEFRITGSGHQKASQLHTETCITYIAGSGTIDTHVNKSLDVTIMGSGIVYYFGNPVITTYITGSGKIVKQ